MSLGCPYYFLPEETYLVLCVDSGGSIEGGTYQATFAPLCLHCTCLEDRVIISQDASRRVQGYLEGSSGGKPCPQHGVQKPGDVVVEVRGPATKSLATAAL